jgi:hypothetical protein
MDRYMKHCDIVLIDQNGKEWPMIAVLLRCKSNYFDTLLTKTWNQNDEKRFTIETNDVWPKIYEWVFTSQIKLVNGEYLDALCLSDRYTFDEIFKYCEKKLESSSSLRTVDQKLAPNWEFLLQPRFSQILIKLRNDIVKNYFSYDQTFTILSTIVSREFINDNNRFYSNGSNWLTKSATLNYNLDGVGSFDYIEGKPIEITLVPGIWLQCTTLKIAQSNSTLVPCDIFGCNSDSAQNELIKLNDNSQFHNRFLIQPKNKPLFKITSLNIGGVFDINPHSFP